MTKEDSIKKLIEDSGLITHHKVIGLLRENGWGVLISPYYYDNISNTVKEVDVIAEKAFYSESIPRNSSVQINVQLFIECKYIKQEIIFWFDARNKDKAAERLERDTGLEILYNRSGADIAPDKFHYVSDDKVAKLFSTNTNREDVIFKAITQVLNAKLYYDQNLNKPLFFEFADNKTSVTLILKYPVIVAENYDKFLKVEFDGSNYHYDKMGQRFQLEINYAYLNKDKSSAINDDFLIDVMDYNELKDYLSTLEKEINAVMHSKAEQKKD